MAERGSSFVRKDDEPLFSKKPAKSSSTEPDDEEKRKAILEAQRINPYYIAGAGCWW